MPLIQIYGVCRFGGIVQQTINIMDTSNNSNMASVPAYIITRLQTLTINKRGIEII